MNLQKQLEKDYPDYFNLKFNTLTVSVSQIQQQLDNESAMLLYFIAQKNIMNITPLFTLVMKTTLTRSHRKNSLWQKLDCLVYFTPLRRIDLENANSVVANAF